MKILFIEDKVEDIQGIMDYCDEVQYEYFHNKFDDGFSAIEEYDPDIIVLDLKDSQEEFEGSDIFERIWESRFRPTCVFSGQIVESTIQQEKYKSPLVAFINKGTEEPVKEFIKKVSPYIDCIRDVQLKAYKAMRKSFDFFDLAIKDDVRDIDIIAALCGNRIKTYFDTENLTKDMPIWSQYIYPVLDERILTGDLIMLQDEELQNTKKNNLFVVLSQSCDIAYGKIKEILLAQCDDIDKLLVKKYNGKHQKEMRSQEELKMIFNAGFFNQYFPLPQIDGVMPNVVVNLKSLKLIKKEELNSNYKKIASLSSPYKERLIWAYMQTACRPGVPDLAVEKWAKSLCPVSEETKVFENGGDGMRGTEACGV